MEERLYRGYCRSMETYKQYFDFFREKKNDIYHLYGNFTLLKHREQKRILKYLDDFYDVIGDERSIKSEFLDACLK